MSLRPRTATATAPSNSSSLSDSSSSVSTERASRSRSKSPSRRSASTAASSAAPSSAAPARDHDKNAAAAAAAAAAADKLKVNFIQRDSRLDSTLESAMTDSPYKGFYNLVGLVIGYFALTKFIEYFSNDAVAITELSKLVEAVFDFHSTLAMFLVIIFLCLVSLTAVGVQKLLMRGVINRTTHLVVNLVYIVAMLAFAPFICIELNFGFSQTLCVVVETCVLVMKVHSYLATNRDFHDAHSVKQQKKRAFDLAPSGSEDDTTEDDTSSLASDSTARRVSTRHRTKPNRYYNGLEDTLSPSVSLETVSPSHYLHYPHNVTTANFVDFLLVPTLVYELHYPRTKKIRASYVFSKLLQFLGSFACLFMLASHYIVPTLKQTDIPLYLTVSRLLVPTLCVHLLMFYIIFECILNVFAELTRFADREFYEDWWNSTTFDEYARKWNKPVHVFLLRHLYLESIKSMRISKRRATFATFLVSSIIHEMVLLVCMRVFTPFLFAMQMSQLVWIYAFQWMKGSLYGNLFVWFGLMTGPPLLSVFYGNAYYNPQFMSWGALWNKLFAK